MPRRLSAFLAAITAIPLLAATALAASKLPDTIPLADGWRPEGIAAGPDLTAFVGSLATGSITMVDLRTGARDDAFVVGEGLPAVGLEYEADADRLWAAGGSSGEVRVYDASSGDELATYAFGTPRFVNDLVVTADAAYATDSMAAELLVIPLGAEGSLPSQGATFELPLSGDWQQLAGFNANGIEASAGSLLVANSTAAQIYAVDPDTGVADALLAEPTVPNADGILLVGNRLYVVQNQRNQIAVLELKGGELALESVITNASFDIPTTVAFAGGSLWAVNARFTTPPTPDTEYAIVRVPIK
jgi:hypothetical protein